MHDPVVCIIDDDEAIRESLRLLLFAEDLQSIVFERMGSNYSAS